MLESMKMFFGLFIPDSIKPILKNVYYYINYRIFYRLKGQDSMIPPRSMIFVGDGDFEKTGQEFKNYFVELAGLQTNNRVLDVGCGIGRMAIPLTNYLSKDGEYWGFDIVKKGVLWCHHRISPKFKNFHFLHSDVYNKRYNPNGKVRAQDFRFPFDDNFFDFVFLTSVFTHMLPLDLENYLSEISRVLNNGGKCLITFFILNEESEKLIRSGRSTLDFKYKIDACLTTNENVPESAIAYKEDIVKLLFNKYGLKIFQPIRYGSWCNRDNFLSYQDMIIATKGDTN